MNSSSGLQKKLGFWAATAIVAGSVIGAGVFMKPASMAAQLGSPVWLTLVWVIAGVFSLLGALIFAELGAMLPESGGIYAYFRHMFGKFTGFLYGWSAFVVINTAAVAAIAFVCAHYADYFLHLPKFDIVTEKSIFWHIPFIGNLYPLENFGVKSLAIFLILVLTLVNYLSVKAGSYLQVVSTIIKLAVIAGLVIGIFYSGNGSIENFVSAENPKEGGSLVRAIVIAMTGAFFAYDGWINVNFIAGEIKNPQKNIPKSLFTGVMLCVVVYLFVNQAYLYVLPVEKIASSQLVAADAMQVAFNGTVSAVVAAMIVICTFGAINGNIMATCRVTYSMGRDKVFAPSTGKIHQRFQTPGNALWLHAIWTSLLVVSGSFDMLADMFVFITWISYGIGAAGIFLLRKKMPDLPRPYKIWGYPWMPVLFMGFCIFYLAITLWSDVTNYLDHKQPVINSLLGLALVVLGIPFYFYYQKKAKKTN